MKKTFFLVHDEARKNAALFCGSAPPGWMAVFSEPTRRTAQNEKLHAMIAEIAKSIPFMGAMVDEETWKRLLVDAFVRVMREEAQATGKPDPFGGQGRVVPSLDGSGVVQLGVQTRGFTVGIAAQFIEYLHSFGAQMGVAFNEPPQR